MSITAELTKLEKEIQAAKTSVNQLEGRREEILDRLKKEFQVDNLEEANELLEDLNEDVSKMEAVITKEFNELKGKFSW